MIPSRSALLLCPVSVHLLSLVGRHWKKTKVRLEPFQKVQLQWLYRAGNTQALLMLLFTNDGLCLSVWTQMVLFTKL